MLIEENINIIILWTLYKLLFVKNIFIITSSPKIANTIVDKRIAWLVIYLKNKDYNMREIMKS